MQINLGSFCTGFEMAVSSISKVAFTKAHSDACGLSNRHIVSQRHATVEFYNAAGTINKIEIMDGYLTTWTNITKLWVDTTI